MLKSGNTVLRAPQDSDLPVLQRLRNDPDLQSALMSRARPSDPGRVKDWIKRRLGDADSVFFVIASLDEDQCLGFVQLTEMDLVNGAGYLGICLDTSAHGMGHARAALSLLESYAHATFRLRKILLKVLGNNRRAIAFYKKSGYAQAGVLRRHHYHAGRHGDVVIMEKFLRARGRRS